MTETGALIRLMREKKELTQSAVAKELGFTNVFLHRIERGQADLPPKYAEQMAKILGLEKDDIIKAMKRDMSNRLEMRAK